MNFINENFGHAYVVLDFFEKRISSLSLKSKINILDIVLKVLTKQLSDYNQELKYRESIYRCHKSE